MAVPYMKHYNRIFNILYTICLCLTVLALARQLLPYKTVFTTSPAVKNTPGNDSAEIRRVALTFDDGPHPVYTEKLLDALKERGVKATFFVTGEHAELHPDVIKRIHDEGHLIGNHTYSHIQLTSANKEQFQNELIQTNKILSDITGDEIQYVRPPYGSWDKKIETELNMFPVLWNVDPLDWCTPTPAAWQTPSSKKCPTMTLSCCTITMIPPWTLPLWLSTNYRNKGMILSRSIKYCLIKPEKCAIIILSVR